MERNQEETGENVGNENTGKVREMRGDNEREEMHCMGSRKCKAKGGNVKGRKSRAAQQKERDCLIFYATENQSINQGFYSGLSNLNHCDVH